MKRLILFLLILLANLFSQEGIIVIDEQTDELMLLGRHSRMVLLDSSFVDWFDIEYKYYLPQDSTLSLIKDKMDEISITVVMGTWCEDSRREVPHFFKIVDAFKFDETKIDLICVDRSKVGLTDEVDGMGINFVPTFIFYREGKEIGRIIETPFETLEKDLAEILN